MNDENKIIHFDEAARVREVLNRGTPSDQQQPKTTSSAPSSPGAVLLNDVESFLSRFVAYPSEHARVAHVLWIVHTHLMDAWESTPRIAFLSPEPGSGKTRALEITELLVPRPIEAINATPAYLFRKVSDPEGLPTILFDEIDTLFGAKAKEHEEIRGILNAGHRRGAMAGRCAIKGKEIVTEELPAYCAVAPPETVEPYRRRVHAAAGHSLRDRIMGWAAGLESYIGSVYPLMPPDVEDRNADVWEPLLAIADAAGGNWAARARVAAVTFVTDAKAATPSLGIRLLADLRRVFGNAGALYTSSDAGVSWTARESNRSWIVVASSSDGQRLVAAVLDGQLYTSAPVPRESTTAGAAGSISGRQYEAITLQYAGGNKFVVFDFTGDLNVQ